MSIWEMYSRYSIGVMFFFLVKMRMKFYLLLKPQA